MGQHWNSWDIYDEQVQEQHWKPLVATQFGSMSTIWVKRLANSLYHASLNEKHSISSSLFQLRNMNINQSANLDNFSLWRKFRNYSLLSILEFRDESSWLFRDDSICSIFARLVNSSPRRNRYPIRNPLAKSEERKKSILHDDLRLVRREPP